MSSSIFLDTTIQIGRLFLTIEQVSDIQSHLRNKKLYTSSTVYMEFKRTVLQDVQYIRTLITRKSKETHNHKRVRISDIDRWLASGEGNFSIRSRDRCKLITAIIKDKFLQYDIPRVELLLFLDEVAESLETHFFCIDLDATEYFDILSEETYIDIAGCALSRPDYPIGNIITSRLSCAAEKTECTLDQFLANHENELQAIHQKLASLSKQKRDEKAFIALTDVLHNGFKQALGERHCWALGDIIIALETPQEAAIYTTNHKHFVPLCEALGKELYTE